MLLGLDIGTTTIKAVLYDPGQGRIVRRAAHPTPVNHPQPEWSEHDPQVLWDVTVRCIREAVGKGETAGGETVRAVAISSMAEAGVLLDAAYRPVAPIIAWYDRRSEAQATQIEREIDLERLYQITGQRVSPSFGLTKLLWIKDTLPAAFLRGKHWLPIPAYLLWRMTGRMAVDATIASRTLAFDQRQMDWSAELLEYFQLTSNLFPPVFPGGSAVGTITREFAEETGLAPDALGVLGGHDHLCAAFASGVHAPGAVCDSTGSANALMMLLPAFSAAPGLAGRGYACYPHVIDGQTVLKGGLKAAGSALEWLARLFAGPEGRPDYSTLEILAAEGVGRRAGPLWLPHLIGSGTPQGDRFSRAAAVGLQIEHTSGDIYRGMLESLAFWMRHNLEEMQVLTGLSIASVTLTGGTARIPLLSQIKAGVLNHPVRVPTIEEAAAAGAALLAGLGCGLFHNPTEALASLRYDCQKIEPDPALVAWYDRLYQEAYLPLYQALQPIHTVLNQISTTH